MVRYLTPAAEREARWPGKDAPAASISAQPRAHVPFPGSSTVPIEVDFSASVSRAAGVTLQAVNHYLDRMTFDRVLGVNDLRVNDLATLAVALDTVCPELSKILKSSAVKSGLETYNRESAKANRLQARFVRWWNTASICLLAAGVVNCLNLAMSDLAMRNVSAVIIRVIVELLDALTILLGLVTAYFGNSQRNSDALSMYRRAQEEAENARFNIFSFISESAAAAGPDVAMFGVGVIARYLLDSERTWLSRQEQRHRNSFRKTGLMTWMSTGLIIVSGIGSVLVINKMNFGPFSPAAYDISGIQWVMPLLAIMGAAIGAYAYMRNGPRDYETADRFGRNCTSLDALAAKVDDVAASVVKEPIALIHFTETITDVLETNHGQVPNEAARIERLLKRMDAHLSYDSRQLLK